MASCVHASRISHLRGVRLRNTSLSPPRLFPTLGSAPTNREPYTLTETWGEIAARGLGNVLMELSRIRVRELILNALFYWKLLPNQNPGKHRQGRMFGDIVGTECYVLSVLSSSQSAPLGVPRSLFETRGWGGMQVHQGSPHPPPLRAAPPDVTVSSPECSGT